MLSPTAPVLSKVEGLAPGGVAMESQPLLREIALGSFQKGGMSIGWKLFVARLSVADNAQNFNK